jgi:molybdopterin converting factor small subunit
MDQPTQLLCTFTTVGSLDETIAAIKNTYKLVFDKIYLLENADDETQLILTYNVAKTDSLKLIPPPSTISVHRKKHTNTIYTINAINKLIEHKNGGKLDVRYRIDWSELQNMVLVTAYGKLKTVNTKLSKIIDC